MCRIYTLGEVVKKITKNWLACLFALTLVILPCVTATALESISDDDMIRGFEKYLPELRGTDSNQIPLLTRLFYENKTSPEVQRGILEFIYNSIISNNPYKDKIAKVRTFEAFSPCTEEIALVTKRVPVCKKAVEKLVNGKLTDAQLPRIGCAFSGGGARAAYCSCEFARHADKAGLADAFLYTSSVSGGTWFDAAAHLTRKRYSEFADDFVNRGINGILAKKPREIVNELMSHSSLILDAFLRRIAFNETPTVIDLYGILLGLTFLGQENKNTLPTIDLTNQTPFITDGQLSIPLYSAIYAQVNKKKTVYSWVEFSPFEVTCYEHKAAVPAWSYGRKFDSGESKNTAPALSLPFEMGIWGSAISISFGELCREVFSNLEPKSLFEPLKEFIEESVIGDVRIFPAKIRNMTYHLDKAPDQTSRTHTIIDAGIKVNVSIIPLLQRHMDIIIVLDFSSDLENCEELRNAEEYARKNNLPFPKIDYTDAAKRTFSIFGDWAHKTPVIVYVPLLQNPRYLPTFDPRQLMKSGNFMHITNFAYEKYQLDLISGYMKQVVADIMPDLIMLMAGFAKQNASQTPSIVTNPSVSPAIAPATALINTQKPTAPKSI